MDFCKKYSKRNISPPNQLHNHVPHATRHSQTPQTTMLKTNRTSQSRRRQPITNSQTRSRNHRLILHQSQNHLRRTRTLRIQNKSSSRKNPPQRSHISPKKRSSLQSHQYDEGIWIFPNSSF